MNTIYLDNAATTRVDTAVIKEMDECHAHTYGNPSSIHHEGVKAKKKIDEARKTIAQSIGATPEEIIFTSGGTEANNLALKGIAAANKKRGNHLVTTRIEHDSVLNACKHLERQGYTVSYLDVDEEGFVSAEALEKSITPRTIMASIIHGNNEIGTIQDLQALYDVCKKHGVILHTDACQSYTKTPITNAMADAISLNAHKLHGPKGVGALYLKKGISIEPQQDGGGQEKKRRSGTENTPCIVGFAKAVEIGMQEEHAKKMRTLQERFIKKLLALPYVRINGPVGERRLCNNINVSFRFIEGESIIAHLDLRGICASTGSACSSQTLEPSHVLMAIEDDPERAHGSVRMTISKNTTEEELDRTVEELKDITEKLRAMSPLYDGQEG